MRATGRQTSSVRVAAARPPPYAGGMAVGPADLAATLIARRRTARERDQVRAEEIRQRLREAARALRAAGAIDSAWLIGSLAWGAFGVRSDADVVVRGGGSSLATIAERLGVGTDVEVDVLRLEDLSESFGARAARRGEAR